MGGFIINMRGIIVPHFSCTRNGLMLLNIFYSNNVVLIWF